MSWFWGVSRYLTGRLRQEKQKYSLGILPPTNLPTSQLRFGPQHFISLHSQQLLDREILVQRSSSQAQKADKRFSWCCSGWWRTREEAHAGRAARSPGSLQRQQGEPGRLGTQLEVFPALHNELLRAENRERPRDWPQSWTLPDCFPVEQ